MGRLIMELNKDALDGFFYQYANINFLHFAIFLFLICSAVLVAVSLLSHIPAGDKLRGLTFQTVERTPESEAMTKSDAWRKRDILLSIILGLAVCAVWLYFTG